MMRFIDVTSSPATAYRYRVALKAKNPNYRKPAKDLAIPRIAEKELLQSDWFEMPVRVARRTPQPQSPPVVQVPPEEYLYAAAKDDRKNR